MEETGWAVLAAVGALAIKPVRERVVPVAKAVGRMGRDVGLTVVAGAGQVVETARHPNGAHHAEGGEEPDVAGVGASTTTEGGEAESVGVGVASRKRA